MVARPIGGILSDRLHPKIVVMISLAGAAVMAVVVALQPPPEIAAGASFIAMAFFLGIGTGGVFAWVARSAPPEQVGSVTGIVGAAGGLGGYFPPLMMGATYDAAGNDYTDRTALLSLTCLLTLLYTAWRMPGTSRSRPANARPTRSGQPRKKLDERAPRDRRPGRRPAGPQRAVLHPQRRLGRSAHGQQDRRPAG